REFSRSPSSRPPPREASAAHLLFHFPWPGSASPDVPCFHPPPVSPDIQSQWSQRSLRLPAISMTPEAAPERRREESVHPARPSSPHTEDGCCSRKPPPECPLPVPSDSEDTPLSLPNCFPPDTPAPPSSQPHPAAAPFPPVNISVLPPVPSSFPAA